MRILIHGINYSPELTGIGKYTGEMAEWLATQGHEVRVVCAPPYYPEWRVRVGFVNGWRKEEGNPGLPRLYEARNDEAVAGLTRSSGARNDGAKGVITSPIGRGDPVNLRKAFWIKATGLPRRLRLLAMTKPWIATSATPPRNDEAVAGLPVRNDRGDALVVYRCPLWVPAQPSGLKRLVHLASFAMTSLPVMLRQVFWRPDVVLVIEPALFCAPAAWLTARLSGAKCWLHIQDFEVDAAFELGIIKGKTLKALVSAIESWLMRRFDAESTISRSMLQRLLDKGIEKPVLFPNWADLSRVRFNQGASEAFRAELGLKAGQTLCLYSGNIAVKQGLEILIDVAARLPDFQFVICGDGVHRKALQKRAEALANVMFLPLQPLDKLAGMLGAADIHLVIQKRGAADLVMPSKLTNILAVGGVAVVTAEADTELGLLASGEDACVYRCDPEDAEQLSAALVFLRENEIYRKQLSAKAAAYAAAHIDMTQVLQKFEADLQVLARENA